MKTFKQIRESWVPKDYMDVGHMGGDILWVYTKTKQIKTAEYTGKIHSEQFPRLYPNGILAFGRIDPYNLEGKYISIIFMKNMNKSEEFSIAYDISKMYPGYELWEFDASPVPKRVKV